MNELLDFDDNLSEQDLEKNGIEGELVEDADNAIVKGCGGKPGARGIEIYS
jgi:hypothetical protein